MFYICAVIKDEHDYIREWVIHNRNLGFDKIVLYDNNSSLPYDEQLGDFIKSGFIEMRFWNDIRWSRQLRAYSDFLHHAEWGDDDWCAFIDVDEYIFFDSVKTISEFVDLYQDYAGVGLCWKTFNANGRIHTPHGIPLPEAYTEEFVYWEPRVKPIAKLNEIECIPSPHFIIPKKGLFVTTGGEPICSQSPSYYDFTNAHIKHFMTKSWEDWVKRLKRGNITKGLRTVDTFFEFNPKLAYMKDELTKNLNYSEFPSINKDNNPWDGEEI